MKRLEDYRWRRSLPAKTSINLRSKHHYRSFQVLLSYRRYFSRLLPIASYNSRNNRELFNAVAFYGKQLSAIYLARRRLAYARPGKYRMRCTHIYTHVHVRVCVYASARFSTSGVINRVMGAAKAKVTAAEPCKVLWTDVLLFSPSFLSPFVLPFVVSKLSGRDEV